MKGKLIKILLLSLLLIGCVPSTLDVKDDLVVEYGQSISNDLNDYLEFDHLEEEEKQQVLKQAKLDLTIQNEEGKEYPAIGEYVGTITYEDEQEEVNVVVKDTTKPTFKTFSDIVETYKEVTPDFNKYFIGEDLTKTTLTVDDSTVDYTKIGTYEIKVSLSDTSSNTIEKTASLQVKEPSIIFNQTKLYLFAKETRLLKPIVNGKDQTVKWSSSKASVATVNEKGLLITKKKGTTTITAEANGVKSTLEVNVVTLPKAYKLQTTKDKDGNKIVSVKKKTGNAKAMIKASKKYVGQRIWCSSFIDKVFDASNTDPYRYVYVGKNFMSIKAGDIVTYKRHVFLALGSPKKETHSPYNFDASENMQELYLIEGGVVEQGSNTPHVRMHYGYFKKDGYRYCGSPADECKIEAIYRFK